MLNFWRSHADYQAFVSDTVSIFSENEILKLQSYSKSREKLASLNLDAVGVLLAPYYSNTGRPAKNQPEILRSIVLMMDLGFTSIDRWHKHLQNDFILATLVGCTLDSLPPLGSYYDFMNRLGFAIQCLKRMAEMTFSLPQKIKSPHRNPAKERSSQTATVALQKQLRIIFVQVKIFHFTMKNYYNKYFPLLQLSLPVILVLLIPMTLPFPEMALVFMLMQILTVIRNVTALSRVSLTAPVTDITQMLMLPGEGTVI